MMMTNNYEQDQQDELQALEAIYPNELSVITKQPIKFALELRTDDSDDDKTNEEYSITVVFEYTPKYPDEPPLIEITEQSEMVDEETAEELLQRLNDEASQNLGMVMIFTLVTSALEWLNSLKDNASERRRLAAERKAKLEEELERKRFEGTRVTMDTFMKWKSAFDIEMEQIRAANRIDIPVGKLTGKQLFEKDRTLKDSDLKFLEEGDVAADIDATGIKVDASLFEDLDIEDDFEVDDE